jgi:hypothetical protein
VISGNEEASAKLAAAAAAAAAAKDRGCTCPAAAGGKDRGFTCPATVMRSWTYMMHDALLYYIWYVPRLDTMKS